MSVSHETKMRGTTVLCRCVDYKHATWSIWKVMSPQAQFDKIIFLPFFSKEVHTDLFIRNLFLLRRCFCFYTTLEKSRKMFTYFYRKSLLQFSSEHPLHSITFSCFIVILPFQMLIKCALIREHTLYLQSISAVTSTC